MPLVMGVDSSTQSTKVEVRDLATGAVVASGRAPHPPAQPPCSEQDPDAWWEALRSAIGDAGAPGVAAMSVAAQQHGLVVADRAGAVVRPAKLWNDTTSAAEAAEMVADLGADRWAHATGSVPTAAFTVTKLAWLARHEPENLERVASVGLPHDHLNRRLTGRLATDRGDASGTGYFDARSEGWRVDLLRRFVGDAPWLDLLPAVMGPTEPVGRLTSEALEFLGLPPTVLVGPGTGDNMAAALGIALEAGEVAVSLGTSGTVYARSDVPTAEATGTVAGFADASGGYLPLVCTLNATKVTSVVAGLLGVAEPELDRLALDAPAGSEGLVLVPYLDGERTPNRPDATGSLVGLRSDVSREAVARAAYEGVVCGLLDGLDVLADEAPIDPQRIVLVGGGAGSAAYRQILADLSGRTVTVPDHPEQAATGACVQAAAVLEGCTLREVQDSWDLRRGSETEPRVSSAAEIRDRYAAARG